MNVTPMPSGRTDVAHQAMPRMVGFFEHFKEHDLPELARIYAREARFKDPFNEVNGLLAIEAIYRHMFQTLDLPHFVVKERLAQGQQAFLTWDFRFRFKGQSGWQTIHGATRWQFDAQGLITDHRDYWDAAEELYEKLPMLGVLMRWVKRRVMR